MLRDSYQKGVTKIYTWDFEHNNPFQHFVKVCFCLATFLAKSFTEISRVLLNIDSESETRLDLLTIWTNNTKTRDIAALLS